MFMKSTTGLPGSPYYPRFPSPLGGMPGPVSNGMVQHPGQYLPYGFQSPMGYFPNPGLHHPMQQPQQQQLQPGVVVITISTPLTLPD